MTKRMVIFSFLHLEDFSKSFIQYIVERWRPKSTGRANLFQMPGKVLYWPDFDASDPCLWHSVGDFDGAIQVVCFDQEETGKLFLCFRKRSIGDGRCAASNAHGSCRVDGLESFYCKQFSQFGDFFIVPDTLLLGYPRSALNTRLSRHLLLSILHVDDYHSRRE
jgi:hypothetical protein